MVGGSCLFDGRERQFPDLHLPHLRAQQHRPEVSVPPQEVVPLLPQVVVLFRRYALPVESKNITEIVLMLCSHLSFAFASTSPSKFNIV